jgi:DNA-binding CsgD family transcriptional regulator
MAALLGRLIAAQRTGQAAAKVPLGCLARLQRAFDARSPAPDHRSAAVHGIVEPLTSRELQILEMLAAGMSNQAIARQLVVSLDTIKKHVSHVLGKLGAASRTEAVARARQLASSPSGAPAPIPSPRFPAGWLSLATSPLLHVAYKPFTGRLHSRGEGLLYEM